MPAPVIHGLIMARDEWPLLEVSVTHALVHHVDRVHVLDHASTDGTAAGLDRLRREWGDRLAVVHLGECPFLQEAATCLLREVVAAGPDDWLYMFDADEFGIADRAAPLRDVLAALDPGRAAARYEVHNWVAPADFSAADVARYAELRFRAAPPVFLPVPAAILVDEILSGTVNYFDVPFESKVIVRASAAGWITAGSHRLAGAAAEAILPPAAFRVAHLPLLDRGRLGGRVSQGAALAANGFGPEHGWQSQMLTEVSERGGLDEFWARHSLAPAHAGGPAVVADDALAAALAPTLALLSARRESAVTGAAATAAQADAAALLPAALRAIRRLQAYATEARASLEPASAERPTAARDRLHDAIPAACVGLDAPPATRRPRGLRRHLSSLFTRPFIRPRPTDDDDQSAVIPLDAAAPTPRRRAA